MITFILAVIGGGVVLAAIIFAVLYAFGPCIASNLLLPDSQTMGKRDYINTIGADAYEKETGEKVVPIESQVKPSPLWTCVATAIFATGCASREPVLFAPEYAPPAYAPAPAREPLKAYALPPMRWGPPVTNSPICR